MIDIGFDPSQALAALLAPLQILFVNLLLSADNALVIAMACRGLPAEQVRRATVFGIVGAIALRLAMGSVALVLLRAPFVQLIAGAVLVIIAVRLALVRGGEATDALLEPEAAAGETAPRRGVVFLGVVWAIILADAAMSLDNVIAISALAQGSVLYIGIGLAMSIPMLVWGSALIRQFLDDNGFFVLAAGMFLGWIAGEIAVADPIVAPSIALDAPALPFAVPLACAIFVLWQCLILGTRQESSGGEYAE
jgi:YjbE family integral membrane protein